MRAKVFTTMIKGESYDLWISDEPEFIRECVGQRIPVIEYTHDDTVGNDRGTADMHCSALDSFLTPWATDSVDAVKNDPEYMKKVVHRFAGVPLTVAETNVLIIRELCESDVESVERIFAEGSISGFTDIWAENKDDKKAALREYCRLHYDLYGYGYYGIEIKGDSDIIGVIGFREYVEQTKIGGEYLCFEIKGMDSGLSPLELGYVIGEKYRRKGYCVAACRELIKKMPGDIFILVDRNNIPGVKTAKRISVQTDIFDSDSSA